MTKKKDGAAASKPKAPAKSKAAAKPKAAKASAAKADSVVKARVSLSSDKDRCPTQPQIVNLIRRADVQSKQASEAAGQVGEMIAKAVETQFFNRKALSIARALNAMSDAKLKDVLDHLDLYRDALKLDERANKQAEMFASAKAKDAAKKEAGEDKDVDNTPKGSKPVMQMIPNGSEGSSMEDEVALH